MMAQPRNVAIACRGHHTILAESSAPSGSTARTLDLLDTAVTLELGCTQDVKDEEDEEDEEDDDE